MKKFCLVLFLLFTPFFQALSLDFSSKITNINAAGFPNIEIMLKVFTPDKQIIKADHFEISEDKKPIEDFNLTARSNKMYMTLVIDRSSSIKPAMNHVKMAAAQFIKSMAKHARISILSFASDLDYSHDFSQDTNSLIKSIVKIRPWGGTALYDALYSACEEICMKASRNDLRTIICLTDGRDSTPSGKTPFSTHTPEDVISFAQKNKIRIITVGLGNDLDERLLKLFAQKTSGWYLQTASAQRLAKLYAALSQRMKLEKYYRLTYTSPKPEPDGTTRIVQISSKLKGKKDQGHGKYTAPKRTAHIPQKDNNETKSRKFSLDMLFKKTEVGSPDTVFLTGPITPPPASPVIGPNAATFLGCSAKESRIVIDKTRERLAKENEANFKKKISYLQKYVEGLERLQQDVDKKATDPALKTFETPRIKYRNFYLQSRRKEIDLYKQKAYEEYLANFNKSMAEMDWYYQKYVEQTSVEEDFLHTNSASTTKAIKKIRQKYHEKLKSLLKERNRHFADTLADRGPEITTSETRETLEFNNEYRTNGYENSIGNENYQGTEQENFYRNQSVDTELKELPINEIIENELEDNFDFNEPADNESNGIPSIDIMD